MNIQKPKPLREQVYEKLKEMIIEGEISPDERIVESDYATLFNISRTPIREAIRMLELEGLVEIGDKGGARIKKITPKDIKEIFKIRVALEGIIIDEIITSKNPDLSALEKLLDETYNLIVEDKNPKAVVKSFAEFNSLLYGLSEFKKVVEMINNINLYLRRFRRISLDKSERRKKAYFQHVELFKAIKDKKLERALEVNKKHLDDSMNFLLNSAK